MILWKIDNNTYKHVNNISKFIAKYFYNIFINNFQNKELDQLKCVMQFKTDLIVLSHVINI
ncbi:hypothetical protein HMPREF1581_00404 [Gardnerella vaginalis JCP8108]|uniref:Uncharacterized protein n=1 Tax=Gardnerella vaginalis JCP8108 TaxID=1261066 RepID=S4GRK8_GARVA|nr:hypothetical protein HMPREF1581_00404 [Gardnerella vaginalis JCP8108]